jgi:HTH-type transcriptional regulator / antitoxin HigA
MMEEKAEHQDIDAFLDKLLSGENKQIYYPLQDLFDRRLVYLDITKNQALKILDIDHKTLSAILTGDAKKIDFVNVLKMADFLEITRDEMVNQYFELVNTTHNEDITIAKKRSFLVNNFNLSSLKKIGLIDSINDFDHIEKRINEFLGYENIFEHRKHKITAAFSSAKRVTNKENLGLWYAAACQSLEKTPNPYEYEREKLIAFFPKIRWHSMNVNNGLLLVSQALFKLGITFIIVPKLTTDIHVRGATLSINDKPCIVLTKYTDFYGSMWFALVHELYHVLYDWPEIQKQRYHLTGESQSIAINENQADKFARQYLFSDEKMEQIKNRIDDASFIRYFAAENHVHYSLIYTFYNWDNGNEDGYIKYSKYMPNFDAVLDKFNYKAFKKLQPVEKVTKERNSLIYNNL